MFYNNIFSGATDGDSGRRANNFTDIGNVVRWTTICTTSYDGTLIHWETVARIPRIWTWPTSRTIKQYSGQDAHSHCAADRPHVRRPGKR